MYDVEVRVTWSFTPAHPATVIVVTGRGVALDWEETSPPTSSKSYIYSLFTDHIRLSRKNAGQHETYSLLLDHGL